jgi:hypothetical protein
MLAGAACCVLPGYLPQGLEASSAAQAAALFAMQEGEARFGKLQAAGGAGQAGGGTVHGSACMHGHCMQLRPASSPDQPALSNSCRCVGQAHSSSP